MNARRLFMVLLWAGGVLCSMAAGTDSTAGTDRTDRTDKTDPRPRTSDRSPSPVLRLPFMRGSSAAHLRAGVRAMERGGHDAAVKAFDAAAEAARREKKPDRAARADYNAGVALLALDREAEANQRWTAAAGMRGDAEASSAALHNLGVAALRRADAALAGKDGPAARKAWAQAAEFFAAALLVAPASDDARYNLEYSRLRATMMEALVQRTAEALAAAEAAVDQGAFEQALEALRAAPEERELVFSLRPALKEPFERLEQRVPQIIAIRSAPSGGGPP
jgi:tetratricopeptide (TPR) repeat protein